MCRTVRRQLPQKMAPQKNDGRCCYGSYADRLDSLKQVLKPYRDNNANCLRAITRSARVNLNKHWKSLENLFAAGGLHDRHSKERAQNATNERLLENRENAVPEAKAAAAADPTTDTVDEKLRRLNVDR